MDYQPIENYAVIGNMRSLALVSVTGSIDFFCFPKFDSPTVFAALLDSKQGGFFCIQPNLSGTKTKQLYLPDTNILLTRFLSEDGIAEMTDFMPIAGRDRHSHVVRKVHVLSGEIDLTLHCHPRFDYARGQHDVEQDGNAVVFTPKGEHPAMVLNASILLSPNGRDVVQVFRLKAGETAFFTFGEDCEEARRPVDDASLQRKFDETSSFWRAWVAQSSYSGRWRETVVRSALALKLLTDDEHGSLIAAGTFGLPEQVGGPRNWDYRFTWLRDSAFTLYAMMRLGFVSEADAFRGWIDERLAFDNPAGPLEVMYRSDGGRVQDEEDLPHLEGYRGSRPVRIGNAAQDQLQLDVYGELMDALYLISKYGDSLSYEEWERRKKILRWLSENWNREDEGIWEVRGGRKHFLHSRLMCWVAFDRAIRLGSKRSLTGPFDWMEQTRDEITRDIHENFWDEASQSFVQFRGSTEVDASILLMPMMRFVSPVDPRWLSTLARIERELSIDTLVYRYRTQAGVDGLSGPEGSFTACSFWLVEALARSRQLEKARLLFEKMLGYANHVGLYAEQLGRSGEHLGNFPQALTHLALISAATYLNRELEGKQVSVWR